LQTLSKRAFLDFAYSLDHKGSERSSFDMKGSAFERMYLLSECLVLVQKVSWKDFVCESRPEMDSLGWYVWKEKTRKLSA